MKNLSLLALIQVEQQSKDQHKPPELAIDSTPAWDWSNPVEIAESMILPPREVRSWNFAGLGAIACLLMRLENILRKG